MFGAAFLKILQTLGCLLGLEYENLLLKSGERREHVVVDGVARTQDGRAPIERRRLNEVLSGSELLGAGHEGLVIFGAETGGRMRRNGSGSQGLLQESTLAGGALVS